MNRPAIPVFLMLLLGVQVVWGWSWFTGYSGSPGSWGTCARSCHGSPGGTITVRGFPSEYVPGRTYEVRVGHDGGHKISNFNAAVCQGIGQLQAGVITAGYNSQTYSHPHEPNGVHLVSVNLDSCTFYWTAPESSIGEVRMYLAGCQMAPERANTDYVLTAQPVSGFEEIPETTAPPVQFRLSPSVVAKRLMVHVNVPQGRACDLRLLDRTGRVRNRAALYGSGPVSFTWTPEDADGNRLSPGTYFVEVRAGEDRLVRRFDIPE